MTDQAAPLYQFLWSCSEAFLIKLIQIPKKADETLADRRLRTHAEMELRFRDDSDMRARYQGQNAATKAAVRNKDWGNPAGKGWSPEQGYVEGI